MKIKPYSFLIFPVLFLLAFAQTAVSSENTPLNREWEGHLSNQTKEFIEVVDTPEEWSALWKRAFDAPAPEVDFKKDVVACIFLGHSADWLYSIVLGDPFIRENQMVIPYGLVELILELSGPFKAGGQYHMKVYEKAKDVKMILEQDFPSTGIR